MDRFEHLNIQLNSLKADNLYRSLKTVVSPQGPVIRLSDNPDKELISFCSNNYLNLANDPQIIRAVKSAVEDYGTGSAASRLISGSMTIHHKLEKQFADFFNKPAALLFPSGWCANEGLLKTLPGKDDLVLIDRMDHASIIDAVRSSQAIFRTYKRNETEKLVKMLSDDKYHNRYIVTETVFSMDGDRSDLQKLVELKDRYNAILVVDEAHSVGCMGPQGRGMAAETGLLDKVDIIVSPLGKAFAANGAIIAGPETVIEYLINKCRAFIYTTAPSVATCAAVEKALEIIRTEPQRRQRLCVNAAYLRNKLASMDLDIGKSDTHIVPVIIGPEEKTMEISGRLMEAGFFISAIRPPTVRPGTARLRISVQCDHTHGQIDGLCDALNKIIR